MAADLRESFLAAAADRVGQPFEDHYEWNWCEGGIKTVDRCMEVGLGPGYDCSGLVIASLSEVIGLAPTDWPRDFRHLAQLEALSEAAEPQRTDVMILYRDDNYWDDLMPPGASRLIRHMGVYTSDHKMIHARQIQGRKSKVTEQEIAKKYKEIRVIPLGVLVEVAEAA